MGDSEKKVLNRSRHLYFGLTSAYSFKTVKIFSINTITRRGDGLTNEPHLLQCLYPRFWPCFQCSSRSHAAAPCLEDWPEKSRCQLGAGSRVGHEWGTQVGITRSDIEWYHVFLFFTKIMMRNNCEIAANNCEMLRIVESWFFYHFSSCDSYPPMNLIPVLCNEKNDENSAK